MTDRELGRAAGALRMAIGAALVLAPRLAARVWIGPRGDVPGAPTFARVVGARDVAIGLATLRSASDPRREDVRIWLHAGALCDAADAAATVLAARDLTPARRVVMPVIAASAAAITGYQLSTPAATT